MSIEDFRLLAGVIAEHTDRRVVGRTRLQKTIKLLQRCGLPSEYSYMDHFYGPYSEGIQMDIALLGRLKYVTEESVEKAGKDPFFILTASESATVKETSVFGDTIKILEAEDTVILELAATYDSYREFGCEHEKALAMLKSKKAEKCKARNIEGAMNLLTRLNLPAN